MSLADVKRDYKSCETLMENLKKQGKIHVGDQRFNHLKKIYPRMKTEYMQLKGLGFDLGDLSMKKVLEFREYLNETEKNLLPKCKGTKNPTARSVLHNNSGNNPPKQQTIERVSNLVFEYTMSINNCHRNIEGVLETGSLHKKRICLGKAYGIYEMVKGELDKKRQKRNLQLKYVTGAQKGKTYCIKTKRFLKFAQEQNLQLPGNFIEKHAKDEPCGVKLSTTEYLKDAFVDISHYIEMSRKLNLREAYFSIKEMMEINEQKEIIKDTRIIDKLDKLFYI